MKTIIFFSIILSACVCFSQDNEKYKLEKDFFLLGTLSNYEDRFKDPLTQDVVDYYNGLEKPIMSFNYNLFKNTYEDLSVFEDILKSQKLTTKINSYFNWKYDENFTNKNSDSLYNGHINIKKIKNTSQKVSFILGVYTRFGAKNDSTFCIRMANCYDKFETCKVVLKDLNCKNITTEIYEAIPFTYTIYFQPSDRLRKYLTHYYFIREKVWE